MQIAANSVVAFHYTVATSEGEHVDKSEQGQPLVYMHGHGQIVPGLEAAMLGKKAGEKFTALVKAEDAYGVAEEGLDLQVPLEVFPPGVRPQIKPGFQFKAEHPTQAGRDVVFTVHQIDQANAFVSGNHPLAGKALNFQVEIAEVRAATNDELSHGHAHGPGGHHHH